MNKDSKRIDIIESLVKDIVFPKLKSSGDKIDTLQENKAILDEILPQININKENIQTLSDNIGSLEVKIDAVANDNSAETQSITASYKEADNVIITDVASLKIEVEQLKQRKDIISTISTLDTTDSRNTLILEEIQNLLDRVAMLEISEGTEDIKLELSEEITDLNKKIEESYSIDRIVSDINKQKEIIEPTAIKGLVEAIRKLSMVNTMSSKGSGATFIPPQTPPQLSKVFTYNTDGTLNTSSDTAGTKTFAYIDGLLTSLAGTNTYRGKVFTYNASRQLTNVTVQ